MRILYICHRFPYPPKRGGKIRPFNMIRHLARSHEVVVCSLARSAQEAEEARGIAPYCSAFHVQPVDESVQRLRMVATLPTHVTASTSYFHSPALQNTISRLLAERRFDLVFVHCSSVAHYVRRVRDVPRILDFGDMDSQKWLEYARFKPFPLSLGYSWEGHRLAAYERRLAREFDLCTATTHAEWETLESYGTGVATDWFPNGVDSEYFSPGNERLRRRHDRVRRAHGLLPQPGSDVPVLPRRAAGAAAASAWTQAADCRRRPICEDSQAR